MELMQQYAFHLVAACLLGLCRGEPDDIPVASHPHCICKPTMRLEWDAGSPVCNNATYDWLVQTVLAQLTKQNANLTRQHDLIERLSGEAAGKDDAIRQLTEQVRSLEDHVSALSSRNKRLTDDLDDAEQHHAHLNPRPKDCADVQRYGYHYSGIYTVYPSGRPEGVEVFCDQATDGGGWLVFQRRQDGSQAFDKSWAEYRDGFGRAAKEFWIGNELLHELSTQREYELRVDLTDFLGQKYHATYDSFRMEDEPGLYTLHIGAYAGTAGDSLAAHDGKPFSTVDADHDESQSGNCSELYGRGGWWFARCYDANLNGVYSNRHLYETTVWFRLRENHEPMRYTEMKFRPKGF